MKINSFWLRIFFAIISGVLYFLSFPKFNLNFLILITFVPFYSSIKGLNNKRRFLLGFISGLSANLGLLYWLVWTMHTYGNMSTFSSFLMYIILCIYLSIYWGIFAVVLKYVIFNLRVIFYPLLWVTLEFIKARIMTGFPWELAGYSFYNFPIFIQISDITGVYGISFLIIMINTFFWDIFFIKKNKKILLSELFTVMIAITFTFVYGVIKIKKIEELINNSDGIMVSVLQGNIEQDKKWSPSYQEETLIIYERLSYIANAYNTDLIVWPETSLPFYFQDMNNLSKRLLKLSSVLKKPILFGSPAYKKTNKGYTYLNRAYIIDENGTVKGYYDKLHLVPFGEYTPLRGLLSFLEKYFPALGNFSSGENVVLLPFKNKKIGVFICYEVIFPELVRLFRKEGAEFFVNITNDAWFGTTSAPYQHLSMALFRAVENRVWIARSANTGISAVISPIGKLEKKTEIFKETLVSDLIKPFDYKTFYTLYGDIFAILSSVICGIYLILIILKNNC